MGLHVYKLFTFVEELFLHHLLYVQQFILGIESYFYRSPKQGQREGQKTRRG